MSITTTNMGLISWTSGSDLFNSSELDSNWQKLDVHNHTSGKGLQIPAGGLAANSVASAAIQSGAVTGPKIAPGAVVLSNLAPNTIGASAIGTLPSVRAFHSVDQSIAHNTTTALNFNSERYDTESHHTTSGTNERLTCVTSAGVYCIFANVQFASDSTGYRELLFRLNGATTIANTRQNAVVGTSTNMALVTAYKLAVNNYVECRVTQTSGVNLNVVSAGNHTPEFGMFWIGDG